MMHLLFARHSRRANTGSNARASLLLTLPALLMVYCATASAAGTEGGRPNVVLVVSDDQGYGDATSYWETDVSTPVMDSIARNGVRFTAFRVNPLCAPTRASLLAGLYSLETGMWRGPSQPGKNTEARARAIKDNIKLLPQYLKEAGYATGIFGKWHLGYVAPNTPGERGFDVSYGFLGGAHSYWPRAVSRILHNGKPYATRQHLTDLFTGKAIEFIREHAGEPFFCYVPYNAVHGPLWSEQSKRLSGTPEWLAKYEQRGVELPRRDYNAVLSHMDSGAGKILETLRSLGLEQNTLFIYLSDNGALIEKFPGNNGPLRGEKGTTYEGGIRVPAVVQWPGVIPPGPVSTGNAVHFDLFSTILEAAGIPVPKTNGNYPVGGTSLLDHLKSGGKRPLPDRYLFWDLFGKMAAVHGDWKLVGQIPNHHGRFQQAIPLIEKTQFELYHLGKDLGEKHDLAGEHPEVYQDLRRRYIEWMRRVSQ